MNQSAYTIFPNKTLEALVRERPRSPHELASIKGVGPVTRERYGSALLAAIAGEPSSPSQPAPIELRSEPKPEPPRKNPFTEPPPEPKPEPPRKNPFTDRPPEPKPESPVAKPSSTASGKTYVPTEEWTWRLLDRGFSLEEAAAIRGLEVGAIVRHATLMARKGHPLDLERCLPRGTLEAWDERRKGGELGAPSEADDPSGLWALFLACRASRS